MSQLDKHLSDDGSLFMGSSSIETLTSQIAERQDEIEAKNKVISEKDSIIASLIECGMLKDRELNDLRIRMCSMERDNCMTSNDIGVSYHFHSYF